MLIHAAKAGKLDPAAWTAAEAVVAPLDLDQALAVIVTLTETYAALLADMSDADFRAEIEPFGEKTSHGACIVSGVLCGCAAYSTQLFLYLKACGREELGTVDLWDGVDAPPVV